MSDIKLVQSWTLENCEPSGQINGIYYDISIWENHNSKAVANVEMGERLLGANDIVLDSNNVEMQIAAGGVAINMISLNSGGSRVQDIKRTINSTYFVETSIEGKNNVDVETFFKKTQSNNITLGLDINNKSDFGLASSTPPVALVINKQNKIIDILEGEIEDDIIKIDSISNITFASITDRSGTTSCFQSDYSQEEVTFWYFVPLQVSTVSDVHFSVSGKAIYTP